MSSEEVEGGMKDVTLRFDWLILNKCNFGLPLSSTQNAQIPWASDFTDKAGIVSFQWCHLGVIRRKAQLSPPPQMVKCRAVSRVQETQSLLGMAVSGGIGVGGGSWTVKRWWWWREEVSTAFWQQLHAYMENRFGSSQISVTEEPVILFSSSNIPPPFWTP